MLLEAILAPNISLMADSMAMSLADLTLNGCDLMRS